MLESLTLDKLLEMGFPYIILLLIAKGLSNLWKDAWPWIKDCLSVRDKRWNAQFEASQERERRNEEQAVAFLKALNNFQDGFTRTNADQHLQILEGLDGLAREIHSYHTTNIALTELLVRRIENSDELE